MMDMEDVGTIPMEVAAKIVGAHHHHHCCHPSWSIVQDIVRMRMSKYICRFTHIQMDKMQV